MPRSQKSFTIKKFPLPMRGELLKSMNDMGLCMICKPGASGRCFNIRFMFLFPRKNRSTSFKDVIQGPAGTENFTITRRLASYSVGRDY